MSVPTYAYAANNPLRYVDPTGLDFVIDDSDIFAWADAWRELTAAMKDPEVGFAVSAAYWDPSYTIYVWPSDEGPHLGPGRGGVTIPRQNENACDMSINRSVRSGRDVDPKGVPMTFRRSFWHELGHGIENWRWNNSQYVWLDEAPYFAERWMRWRSDAEALRFQNRTGGPWQSEHY